MHSVQVHAERFCTVSDQGRVKCLNCGTCMPGKRVKTLLLGPCPLIPVSVSAGIRRAWMQPEDGWPLHFMEAGFGYQNSEHAALKPLCWYSIHSPPWSASVNVLYSLRFLSLRKINHCCVQLACIDPFSIQLKPNLRPEYGHFLGSSLNGHILTVHLIFLLFLYTLVILINTTKIRIKVNILILKFFLAENSF